MATLPKRLMLRMEDAPDAPEWAQNLFEQLNAYSQQLDEVLASIPRPMQAEGVLFTTDAAGSAYVDVKNPLPDKPSGVAVDKLNAADNSAISSVYSFTWQNIRGAVRLLFVGLAASTSYRLTVSLK